MSNGVRRDDFIQIDENSIRFYSFRRAEAIETTVFYFGCPRALASKENDKEEILRNSRDFVLRRTTFRFAFDIAQIVRDRSRATDRAMSDNND